MVVLFAAVALLLGALLALSKVDRSYARAQDQAERALRALLAPASAPRPAQDELGELAAALARFERVAVRVELEYSSERLAADLEAFLAGAAADERFFDRLVTSLSGVESRLAATRDALSGSFYTLIGALGLGLFAAIAYFTGLRFRLGLSRLEAEWRKRGLQASLAAEEELKRRIAGELHDDAAQDVAAAKMLCERARASPESAPERAAEAAVLLAAAGRKLRSLALDLRPAELETQGLARALETLCSRATPSGGAPVGFCCSGELPRVADAAAIQAYRVAQEALTNARKHAPGHQVELRVEAASRPGRREGSPRAGIMLTLRDHPPSGQPAPPEDAAAGESSPSPKASSDPAVSSGMGLGIMRERAALAGCELEIHIDPHGSSVRLFVPAEDSERGM